MAERLKAQHHWIFCVAALGVWLALGWPFLRAFVTGASLRGGFPMPVVWLVPFTLFGAAVFAEVVLKLPTKLRWSLLCVQVAAVVAMATILPSDLMSIFLIIIAWQVATATSSVKALSWVAVQTLAVAAVLAQATNPDIGFVGLSLLLQLSCVLTAHALRNRAQAARALVQANRELRSAQALIANRVRDAERLRISRELHDAWGHELTALGLQLEIASHVTQPGRASDHVMQAKGLARDLLVKVRDVVATLRNADQSQPAAEDLRSEAPEGSGAGSRTLSSSTPSAALQTHWLPCVAALAVWIALGSPVIVEFATGGMVRNAPVSALWFIPFTLFGAAALAAMALKLQPKFRWALLFVQVACVAAMAYIVSWAGMAPFLIIVAWQAAMAAGPAKALGWVAFQTLVVIAALILAPNPDICWVIGKAFALQLFVVFTAQALRREAETARALAQTNRELRAAQAIIANNARDAERLRISRELHDAWGHELTALGLQLEIASHVSGEGRASDNVIRAKGLARDLLGKVRDVVATLRDGADCNLKDALEALAQSVPTPAIHVSIAPAVRVSPDQAHALMRCAQEAVTNAVKHAQASNLWLQVTPDGDGVRLVARNDGNARPAASTPGSGLLGMRERVESLGGRLAVRAGADFGFMVDAWLPSKTPQTA